MYFGLMVPEFSSNPLKRTQTQHAYISITACEVITAKEYTLICFKQPLVQNSLGSVMLTRCSLAMPHARCTALLPCTSPEQHELLQCALPWVPEIALCFVFLLSIAAPKLTCAGACLPYQREPGLSWKGCPCFLAKWSFYWLTWQIHWTSLWPKSFS